MSANIEVQRHHYPLETLLCVDVGYQRLLAASVGKDISRSLVKVASKHHNHQDLSMGPE